MRAARWVALFFSALALLCLPGCFGSAETDQTAFVLAMGFDKGEKDTMVVTVSIANPRVIAGGAGGGGGEEGKNVLVMSVETFGPLSGLEQLNTVTGRHLSLLHAKAYVFSEELAREGLADWFTTMSRYYELRATSFVFVCRGKAKDFLEKNQPPMELSPTKQYELLGITAKTHGFYNNTMFKDFYQDVKSWSTEPSLPLVALHEGGLETTKLGIAKGGEYKPGRYLAGEMPVTGENKAQVIGTAVFRGSRLVGLIDGRETRHFLMLRGIFKRGFITFLDPLIPVPSLVGLTIYQRRSPKYTTAINEDGRVTVSVDLDLEADLTAIISDINYENPELKPVLEEAISREVEQDCLALIKRTQEEFQSDICGFGHQLKRHFWTTQAWRDFNWLERYPEAQVDVTVHTRIRRTGLLLKTSQTHGE